MAFKGKNLTDNTLSRVLIAQKTDILFARTVKEMCSKKGKSKKPEKTSKFVGTVIFFL